MMKNINTKSGIQIIILVAVAIFSLCVCTKVATSTKTYTNTIATLDRSKDTVLELTAASTSTSAALTLLPGDTTTPIAEKLADFSTYFLIVIVAIYLEKYLLVITGYATFGILIPLACIFYIIHLFTLNDHWNKLSKKFAFFGIAIVLIIPVSVKITNLIENTYGNSIQETITVANDTTDSIQSNQDDANFLEKIASQLTGEVSSKVSNVENILNNFIESLAVMIVTGCIIPILVMLFFYWIMKLFLGLEYKKFTQKVELEMK